MADITFPQVSLNAPVKKFKKDKETRGITVLTRVSFDATAVDDETAMLLTRYSDTGIPIKVTVQLP